MDVRNSKAWKCLHRNIAIVCFLTNVVFLLEAQENKTPTGEKLYNGIELPYQWPPKMDTKKGPPVKVPYLSSIPKAIPINVGRQLFVDDFLIAENNLKRTFHLAEKYKGNPVLKPETALELNGGQNPVAAPFNDGVWYDPKDKLFKMWYHAGWFDGTGYAISKDGIKWERPDLDISPGTNRVLPHRNGFARDGSTIWLDTETKDLSARYKMFIFHRFPSGEEGELYKSPDGIHWNSIGLTGKLGDNSGFFKNPFRDKWVFSIRTSNYGRARGYHEANDFFDAGQWNNREYALWQQADSLDEPDKLIKKHFKDYEAQLYNVDAVAYESIMLGLFAIHRGPNNEVGAFGGFPKLTDLTLGYSRDGFYFDRPDRRSFIPSTRKIGDWDRAYIHSAGGCVLVVNDSLYFYYGAWSGESPKSVSSLYAGGSTGLAKLRRDGFASLDADEKEGYLTTRPVVFNGKYLFVNIENLQGELRVEVLNQKNQIIKQFSKENCIPVSANKTLQEIKWKNKSDLSSLANQPITFKFYLTNGKLYSFWVSPDKSGASYGYVGAGGPGFNGNKDDVGINGYQDGFTLNKK